MRDEPLVGSRPRGGGENAPVAVPLAGHGRNSCARQCSIKFEPARATPIQVVDGERAGLRVDANGDHDTLC
jgi:hypothetical protein